MYLDPELVKLALSKIGSSSEKGKKLKEQTTGLTCFLVFDLLAKNEKVLDFNHATPEGKKNRDLLFEKYGEILGIESNGEDYSTYMDQWGNIVSGGRTLKKKFSSDFLTAPLKKGSRAPIDYPGRPAPLLRLGEMVNGSTWGIGRFVNWKQSLESFLVDTKSDNPWLDLAILIFRGVEFSEEVSFESTIEKLINKSFSKELAGFWRSKIAAAAQRAPESYAVPLYLPLAQSLADNPQEDSFSILDLDAFVDDLHTVNFQVADELPIAISSALHAKPFLLLTGLSGSGKTQLAQVFSKWITPKKGPKELFSAGLEIKSSRSTYKVEAVGSLGLKVNQSGNDSCTFLPFDLIDKWIEVIQEEGFDAAKNAQEIQAAVQAAGSGYSNTVNSFHSPLKALAFYKINHQDELEKSKCVELIAVGADWTSNENLLGYPDALKEKSYRKPDNGALDLILRAQKNHELPHFLILDEMNLSHVERYFADFLSAMEISDGAIRLHDGDENELWDGVPAKLKIPKNLFVIGTVNVDETTYMFSPKVLDRANVIEFRVAEDEMESFLANPVKPNLDAIAGQGVPYAKAFVAAAKEKEFKLVEQPQVSGILMKFFPELKEAGAEFGYRTAHEICRFVYFHKQLSSSDWKLEGAMDAAIMQKLLPKLHGARRKLEPILEKLEKLCEKDYPGSLEKIQRMLKRLREHGFTSFAEA